jgi:hypothetical protein
MDAIRAKEWKMFVILRSLREEVAYVIFALAHLPLYFAIIFTISQTNDAGFIYLITDLFLMIHTVIHFLFRRNKANGFSPVYSNILIYLMGFLALIHLILML